MKAIILDTETTHSDPETCEPIELAFVGLGEGFLLAGSTFEQRFRPERKISFGAMAVHHILPEELADCPPAAHALASIPAETEYFIGHNVDFDWKVLGKPKVKRICTLALARKLWPNMESHTLGACYYLIGGNFKESRERLKQAHSASHDVIFCYELLHYMLREHDLFEGCDSIEALWQISEKARVPEVWSFGKHKGTKIAHTPAGYLRWCLNQPDMDEYVKKACYQALDKR